MNQFKIKMVEVQNFNESKTFISGHIPRTGEFIYFKDGKKTTIYEVMEIRNAVKNSKILQEGVVESIVLIVNKH